MNMKRFLILLALITYSVVGCGGPNKSVKPDVSRGNIEKDTEECIQSIDPTRSQTFTGWLAKKGDTLKSVNEKWKEWCSKHEEILVSINPLVVADVILTIPVVLTIRLIDQLKAKESPKQDNKVEVEEP
jgi:hypothetical protein